ncbi:MAG: hypothetical protein LBJ76_04685 [Candidatus Accumulibacter sp.]|nr:hypothetical protein [Accumulibacter sp.]
MKTGKLNRQIMTVVLAAGLGGMCVAQAADEQEQKGRLDTLRVAFNGGAQSKAPQTAPVAPAPAILTPEQQKAKATLEKIFTCEQTSQSVDVIKLLKVLGATKGKAPAKEPAGLPGGGAYKLNAPLKLWGANSYYFNAVDQGYPVLFLVAYFKSKDISQSALVQKAKLKKQPHYTSDKSDHVWERDVKNSRRIITKSKSATNKDEYFFVQCYPLG